jgi:hypothetical protein
MQHSTHSLRWLVLVGSLFVLIALFSRMVGPMGVLPVSADDGPGEAAALAAPNPPVLVKPANGATGVVLPVLKVNVSDTDGDAMCVTFYGRQAAGADFTLFLLPDTQNMATSYPTVFNFMTQYISDTKTTLNVAFATCTGDLVNTASSDTEYQRADAAYDILDTANVPYSVGPGNHDSSGGLYETYFGVSRFSGKSWYGGHYGSDNRNNYSLFSASGMDFILINLDYNAGSAQRNWADALLKTYSSRRGIVEQHDMLNTNNSWVNQTTYNELKDNPNLFLMLCGHMHAPGDGAAYVQGTGDDGHTIHVVMADYQDFPSGGNGYERIFRFSPANDVISMTTYSPYTGGSITTDPDQKNLAYAMPGGGAFTSLGMVCNVPSGGSAYLLWSGLASYTKYEWYAIVSDGTVSTTGTTWGFTTDVPNAVQLTSFTADAARERIVVRWATASKVDSLGFDVYRATSADCARERLTAALLPSHAPGSAGDGHYEFVDETARAGVTYYYWLEELDVNGARQWYGPVSARESLYFKPPPARD